MDGLGASVRLFQEGVQGVDAQTVMDLIMITQYFDMMEKFGCSENKGCNTLFIPGNTGAGNSLGNQLRQGMLEAQATQKANNTFPSAPSMRTSQQQFAMAQQRMSQLQTRRN